MNCKPTTLIFALVLMTSSVAHANNSAVQSATSLPSCAATRAAQSQKIQICSNPDVRPGYPGGPEKLHSFFASNLRYPDGVNCGNGTIKVEIVVTSSGKAVGGKIVSSDCPALDSEAKRVAKLARYTPATLNGKPVNALMGVTVSFRQPQTKAAMSDYYYEEDVLEEVSSQSVTDASDTIVDENTATASEKPSEREEIFTAVEQPPTFPGGETALYKFVGENLRYPAAAQENGVEGRVIVQFVVQKDGTIGQAKVVKSVDPDLDKEALRLVRMLPKFVPGKMNGQAVNVWYTIPIRFKLGQ